ncbi:MAG: alpha/beta hydrolase [Pseudomonadota bacterium]
MTDRPGWPTDPEMLAFLHETARHYPATGTQAGPQQQRIDYTALCEAFAVPYPPSITASDRTVTAENPRREIPIRHYVDSDLFEGEIEPDLQTGDEKLARLFGRDPDVSASDTCLLYAHGGGWVVGDLESHDSICAELCVASELDVIAVDYRLAPEHPAPAALDDFAAVYEAIRDDYANIVVGGDSAGGQLTAALCHRLRARGDTMPVAQLLIYPALGAPLSSPSYTENANAPGLTTADVAHYWDAYAGAIDWQKSRDPELVPLTAESCADLPAAIIVSAGCDPLRDDAMLYANMLTRDGVPVAWRNDPQLVHGHLRARHMSNTAMECFVWICRALGDVVNQPMLGFARDDAIMDDEDD